MGLRTKTTKGAGNSCSTRVRVGAYDIVIENYEQKKYLDAIKHRNIYVVKVFICLS